jgi:DMSO/TMAO reductase YedYZ heme-binding membrane subunit
MKGFTRRACQAATLAGALAALAVPPLVLAASGTASVSGQWTALRLLALYALTLLFFNVLTGAARPLFNLVFPPRHVYVAHNFTGLAAFILALGHGVLVIIYGLTGYKGIFVALGPAALALLAVTVSAALARKRLKRAWRWLHRLNYLLFLVALVHAWQLGFDLKYSTDKIFTQVVVLTYTLLAAAATAYRLSAVARQAAKRHGQAPSA